MNPTIFWATKRNEIQEDIEVEVHEDEYEREREREREMFPLIHDKIKIQDNHR